MSLSGLPMTEFRRTPEMIAVLHESVRVGADDGSFYDALMASLPLDLCSKAIGAFRNAAGAAWQITAFSASTACWVALIPATAISRVSSRNVNMKPSSSCWTRRVQDMGSVPSTPSTDGTPSCTAALTPPALNGGSTPPPPPLQVDSPAAVNSPPESSSALMLIATAYASPPPSPGPAAASTSKSSAASPLGPHQAAMNSGSGGGAAGGLVSSKAKPAMMVAGVRRKDKRGRRGGNENAA